MPTFSEIQALLADKSSTKTEESDNRYLLGPTQNELGSAYDDGNRVSIRAFHKISPDLVYVFASRYAQILGTISSEPALDHTPLPIIKSLVIRT